MQRQNNTKSMVESGVLTAVAVVFILLCYYLPGFLLVGIFIWPIPITLIYIRHGAKYGVMSLAVTFVLTAITTDPLSAVGLVAVYGLLGVVLGYCIKKEKNVSTSLLILSGAAFVSTLCVIQLFSLIAGHDIISQGIDMLTKSMETTKNIYKSMGMKDEDVKTLMKSLPSAAVLKVVIPSAFLTYSVTAAFLCYLITQKVLKRFKYTIPPIKPVSEWHIPSGASFAIIIMFGVSFLLMYAGVQNGQTYFINAMLIFNYTFTVSAVAFLAWMLKKWDMQRVLRVIVIIFCILPPIGRYLYLLGILDYIFDFRKLDPMRKRLDK